MLVEFTCSNHRSILKPVTFSFVASADKTRIEQTFSYKGMNVLPSAIIYGANGSGKTSSLDALRHIKLMVLRSMAFSPQFTRLQRPHKLAAKNNITDSQYTVSFVKNGVPYRYGFVLGKDRIQSEFLYTYPNGRKRKIFSRDGEKVSFGTAYKREAFSAALGALRKNRLFLSCAADLCGVSEILEAHSFFCEDLVFCWSGSQNTMTINYLDDQGAPHEESWETYALREIQENESLRKQILRLMNDFGHPFKDIQVESKSLSASDFPPIFKDDVVQNVKIQARRAKVDWGEFSTDLFAEESSGIRKLCWFLVPFLDVLREGKVLICDELDNHLHESVVIRLIDMMNQQDGLKNVPQFLLTAHSSSFLTPDRFRRDQIWFTELRPEDRSTDLYSLSEIKDVRAGEDYRRGYLRGRYGAIPALNYGFSLLANEDGDG